MENKKTSEPAAAGHRRKYDETVAEFIDEFWKTEFRSPSMREIMEHCHVPSTSVVRNILQRLAERGDYRLTTDGSARGMTPTWVIEAIQAASAQREREAKE